MSVMSSYPSYETYEQMMLDFTTDYPELCQLVSLGTLQSGRKILAIQIGEKVEQQNERPNFLYTSTMHGDELAGFPTMLMLIDHLLCNYDQDPQITALINQVNIFINPLANPNGTYRGGNESVVESIRFNASFVDLNRNFPDPKVGENPDGNVYQVETEMFIDFAKNYNINLSCNIHSGAELINYPWDTFEHLHADDEWWQYVSREYVDTVHHHAESGYMEEANNGISNGFEWYEIQGGRQDYMTFFERGREFTLEISSVKKLNSDQLPEIWTANKSALINYIEEARFGLTGHVVDCLTKEPLEAEIIIQDHDIDNASVFSNPTDGRYYRYLKSGDYTVQYIATAYDTVIANISIADKKQTVQEIELCPMMVSAADLPDILESDFEQRGSKLFINPSLITRNLSIQISSMAGQQVLNKPLQSSIIELEGMPTSGIYLISILNDFDIKTIKFFISAQ